VDNVGEVRDKESTYMEPTDSKTPKRRHDEAFKQAAVELLVNSGKPAKQIAQELGVSLWNLRDWKKRYLPPPPARPRTVEQAEAENRALREELQRVKNQRDILKKTLGIISAPPDNDSRA
jgi:transposase